MSSPYLTSLGISLVDQNRVPSQSAYPRRFNPAASSIWSLAITALTSGVPAKAWMQAISKFLDLCQEKNVYPFRDQGSNNQNLLDHLKQCREEVVRVLEDIHAPLLSQYSVLRIKRSARLTAKGFVLTVTSTFILDDPTFKQHLVNKGFIPEVGNKLKRRVSPYTWVVFWYKAGRWYVSYVLSGPHIPEMLDKLPARARLEKYIVQDLWRPLTKQARPLYIGPRFI